MIDDCLHSFEKRFGIGATPSKLIECLTYNGSGYKAVKTRNFEKLLGLKPIKKPLTSWHSNVMA